jgi:hypothetical protein
MEGIGKNKNTPEVKNYVSTRANAELWLPTNRLSF